MLIEIYFTIAKFAILRGIYFTIATFAKVRSQKQYSQLRYSQFNRVTTTSLYKSTLSSSACNMGQEMRGGAIGEIGDVEDFTARRMFAPGFSISTGISFMHRG